MTQVIFIDRQGNRHEIDATSGTSLMEIAVNGGIPGIYAECGGTCSCATCHCYVDERWLDKIEPMGSLEDGMLDGARERRRTSRLTCQIQLADALDGIELEVADNTP